jgi:glycerophosphoryl diester phosphodiesterase
MYDRTRLSTLMALVIMMLALQCKTSSPTVTIPTFDKQGHRGARGLMPENTIPAMRKAIDLGVTTLEMDAVISRDNKVVVSHDPFFSWEISTTPEGKTFSASEEKKYNLYAMGYAEIRKWDVGMKPLLRFPRQQKMKAYKPLLEELIDSVEQYTKAKKLPAVQYNIETKSDPKLDGVFQPGPEEFTDLLMAVVKKKKIEGRTIIQSFDERTLQVMHRKYPKVRTAYLVEGADHDPIDKQLAKLGFLPSIYSPEYIMVTPELVKYCHSKGIKVIPWTVNDKQKIELLKNMGVDGIISDYPDLF